MSSALTVEPRPRSNPRPFLPYQQTDYQHPQLTTTERTSVSVELSRSGSAVMISESGSGGASVPKRIIASTEFPFFADMRLRDGSWITIEVRRYSAADLPADFDEDAALLNESAVVFKPLSTRCNLLSFSED